LAKCLARLCVLLVCKVRYRLYIRLLNSLAKLKFILNLILSPPLTASKYRKVINRKPRLYYILANLNIPLYPLAYIIAQAAFKAILITPYGTTLITSALRTLTIYLFIVMILLSILSMFRKSYSTLKT